ncbi:DUF7373 family lipoprotein [Mycolicibacterium aubagnense]|uniref:Uncharacterized protein n=1 Tax=Mycolicibacterium aubagnense TaxID=319707 RepID=A0ABM7IL43_9MYCO|nr:hypothetical protein [Mycolicibacterium aubagnense]TLH65296.1 hypothetical protein C1S80_10320 [Mycolicibacterium aubagnense]WGI31097.1 hypothetical protein QDT91_17720 [Mycolicibacterium aubagnense]BBX87518.1 hypothetical protein MAUB_53910 [Mycolicibacterium aubagnense]
MGIRKLALVVATCLCAVTACSTTTTGTARFGGSLSDPEPDVSQLRTGNYQIKPSTPFFSAGDDPITQSLVESIRLAEFVVGPWEVDSSVSTPVPLSTHSITPTFGAELVLGGSDGHVMQGIVQAHNLVAGFGSARVAMNAGTADLDLTNAVMMFPDAGQAAAAAAEFVAQIGPVVAGGLPTYPVELSLGGHPVPAVGWDVGTKSVVVSFVPHGRYVLFQDVWAKGTASSRPQVRAKLLAGDLLGRQTPLIDGFVPTEPAKLAGLAKDPSNDQLLSKTLTTPDRQQGVMIGTWRPNAWLHFETDPVTAGAQFQQAGVQWVTQRWGRVYQAPNAQSAANLLDSMTRAISNEPNVTLSGAVPGFPGARCFERTSDYAEPDTTVTFRILSWHFSCLARTDKFVFQVFADDETTVNQQISAQYRVLSGK